MKIPEAVKLLLPRSIKLLWCGEKCPACHKRVFPYPVAKGDEVRGQFVNCPPHTICHTCPNCLCQMRFESCEKYFARMGFPYTGCYV